MHNYIGAEEAARRLGVDRSTVTRWAVRGKIAAVKLGSGRTSTYAFSADEVDRVVAERAAKKAAS